VEIATQTFTVEPASSIPADYKEDRLDQGDSQIVFQALADRLQTEPAPEISLK